MFYEDNNSAKLLNMEDVIIEKVENQGNELHVYIKLPRKVHECPCCGSETNKIHDYREQKIKDIPFGRTTYLHLRKRRYVCNSCGKRFAKKNPLVARYYRLTRRCVISIIHALQNLVSTSDIAKKYNVSTTSVFRYFKPIQHTCYKLPGVLSIDEFKGNTGGEKYQTILTDAKNKVVLDILPNRKEQDLKEYFRNFENRRDVQYFICDMNPHFRSVAKSCFPNAKIIVDRYHVSRQVIWAMESVRKAEQKKYFKLFRTYFKHSRKLLNKKELTLEEMQELAIIFENSPLLAEAYRLKNQFLDVMHTKNDRETAKKKLSDWLMVAEAAAFRENDPLVEFQPCITACHNWFSEILNSLEVPFSNGFTEGCNNKIKVLKRVCFGFRNFEHFRSRILHCSYSSV